MVETVSDEGRKLGSDPVAGRFFEEAVQDTRFGKRPGESQPASQAERGCAAGSAQERSTVQSAQCTALARASFPTGRRLLS